MRLRPADNWYDVRFWFTTLMGSTQGSGNSTMAGPLGRTSIAKTIVLCSAHHWCTHQKIIIIIIQRPGTICSIARCDHSSYHAPRDVISLSNLSLKILTLGDKTTSSVNLFHALTTRMLKLFSLSCVLTLSLYKVREWPLVLSSIALLKRMSNHFISNTTFH